jgi:hypothetical protein
MLTLAMILAMPMAAAQGHRKDQLTKPDEARIVCPVKKTGDASFDAFFSNISRCKEMPVKHWWEFWKHSRSAVRTKKIRKEPTASSAFFLFIGRDRLYNKRAF